MKGIFIYLVPTSYAWTFIRRAQKSRKEILTQQEIKNIFVNHFSNFCFILLYLFTLLPPEICTISIKPNGIFNYNKYSQRSDDKPSKHEKAFIMFKIDRHSFMRFPESAS